MRRIPFREQLEAIRPQLGMSTPSIHPILHIDLDLQGNDPEQALRIARHEVLKWVARRVGNLPKVAWEFQSFEHLPGGSAAYAVRLQRDDCDYWITRCDDPDKSVAGRTWTTEVSVVGYAAGARFAIRQQMATRESLPSFVPAVPGIVQQVTERPGLHRWGRPLSVTPWLVGDDDNADRLIWLIEDPRRRRPTVVVSLGEEETNPATAVVDVTTVAKRVLGLAHFAVVTGPITFRLSDRWGKQYSCFHRAVRMYLPRFDPDQDSPYEHPLALPQRIEAWHDRGGTLSSTISFAARRPRASGRSVTTRIYLPIRGLSRRRWRRKGITLRRAGEVTPTFWNSLRSRSLSSSVRSISCTALWLRKRREPKKHSQTLRTLPISGIG
jgi:hypothetical protein